MFRFLLKILLIITLSTLALGWLIGSEVLIYIGRSFFVVCAIILSVVQPFVLHKRFTQELHYSGKQSRLWLLVLFITSLIFGNIIFYTLYYSQYVSLSSAITAVYFFIGSCMYFYTLDFDEFHFDFNAGGKNLLHQFPDVILIMEIVGFISAVLGIISFFRN